MSEPFTYVRGTDIRSFDDDLHASGGDYFVVPTGDGSDGRALVNLLDAADLWAAEIGMYVDDDLRRVRELIESISGRLP